MHLKSVTGQDSSRITTRQRILDSDWRRPVPQAKLGHRLLIAVPY